MHDPKGYTRFVYNAKVNPNIVIGFKKGGGSEAQAFRYPVGKWTEATAKKHCDGKGGTFEPAAKKEQKGQGKAPAGAGGTDGCACPNAKCSEYKKAVSHERGVPCNKIKCSVCGTPLTGVGTVGSKLTPKK
ncbi:MAG: hypothetical protein ABID54_00285 [Pseudomonadota bacterium]